MDVIPALVYATCLILTALYIGPVVWAGIGFRKLFRGEFPLPDRGNTAFVSVIIAARNEEKNIRGCLASITTSNYPPDLFEIIVVDDDSSDNTMATVRQFAAGCGPDYVIRVLSSPDPPATGQKKAALAHGIASARGDVLLLTDADCRVSPDWMPSMIGSFRNNTGFVVGPVHFDYDSTAWSQVLALEFMGLTALAAGAIGQRRPFSCSGASIAFRRSAYEEAGGYRGLENLSSGDDEMLMHRIARNTAWRINYCCVPYAVVDTPGPASFREFCQQRRRWASKSTFYEHFSLRAGVLAGLLFIGALLSLLVAGLFNSLYWLLLLTMLLAKIMAEMSLLYSSARTFGRVKLLGYHVLVQPFHILYVGWAGVAGLFGRFEWKDRTLLR